MADREFDEEFDWELDDLDAEDSVDTDLNALAEEALCEALDQEYFEWLEEYFEPFFERESPEWDWMSEQARKLGLGDMG